MVHMQRSGNNLEELVFSFLHVGSGDITQVIRLGDKYIYLLSHLAGQEYFYLRKFYI